MFDDVDKEDMRKQNNYELISVLKNKELLENR